MQRLWRHGAIDLRRRAAVTDFQATTTRSSDVDHQRRHRVEGVERLLSVDANTSSDEKSDSVVEPAKTENVKTMSNYR